MLQSYYFTEFEVLWQSDLTKGINTLSTPSAF
jgi:hypothetical protein